MANTAARFRKKAVVIDAVQWDGAADTANAFLGERFGTDWWFGPGPKDAESIVIPTLEGNMVGRIGDWIIRGVNGEFYPCKPDIFAKTYEPAPVDENTPHRFTNAEELGPCDLCGCTGDDPIHRVEKAPDPSHGNAFWRADPKAGPVLDALGQLNSEAFSWLVRACLPKAMLHGGGTQIWPDGLGGFTDRAGIERVQAAAKAYLGES